MIGGKRVNETITDLIDKTRGVVDSGIPASPGDAEYIRQENLDEIYNRTHRNVLRDYTDLHVPADLNVTETQFRVMDASPAMLRESLMTRTGSSSTE